MNGPGDKSYFSVFCRDDFTDRRLITIGTRSELIADILGAHITDLVWVVEWNEAEGWARDISKDFALDLRAALAPGESVRTDIRDFLEDQYGVGTVLRPAA